MILNFPLFIVSLRRFTKNHSHEEIYDFRCRLGSLPILLRTIATDEVHGHQPQLYPNHLRIQSQGQRFCGRSHPQSRQHFRFKGDVCWRTRLHPSTRRRQNPHDVLRKRQLHPKHQLHLRNPERETARQVRHQL